MTATLLGRPHAFEKGDRIFLTTPLTIATPTDKAIEEYAFASAVTGQAPNEHIGWLAGRYVEGGKGNLNNAMWLNDELALKQLTPMLMPVTVMHDPRTAVGTIADCQLIGADASNSRIDTILAIWKHRFPDIWEEAEANIDEGTMMQSMECFSPSYLCSDCGQQYVKLPEGKEQASWCDHLRSNSSRRILQDVCFTGTGLIFGSRGGRGAYTEAFLDHFQDEIAEFHAKAHIDGRYHSKGATSKMGYVQIDEQELADLRSKRDSAMTEVATVKAELTTKVEAAEAETVKEREGRETAEKERDEAKQVGERAALKDKRLSELGSEFIGKMGDFTRTRLAEAAATQSDEEWEATLKEKEELTGTERAAGEPGGVGTPSSTQSGPKKLKKKDGENPTQGGGGGDTAAETAFSSEELASDLARIGSGGSDGQRPAGGSNVPRQLARSFRPKRTTATTS